MSKKDRAEILGLCVFILMFIEAVFSWLLNNATIGYMGVYSFFLFLLIYFYIEGYKNYHLKEIYKIIDWVKY